MGIISPPTFFQVAVTNVQLNNSGVANIFGNAELTISVVALYSSYDFSRIIPGMWISGGVSGFSWRVVSTINSGFDSNYNPTIDLIVEDEDNVINAGYFKTVIDSVALKNALVSGVDIDGVKLEIVYNEPSLRINKRKAK